MLGGVNSRDTPLPAIDERLAVPETHTQVVDGVVVKTMGANPPHATHHAAVARIFADCLAAGYEAAVDMLTRVDDKNDLAPDVSVFPTGTNKKTGGRKLEELTFEVCDSEGNAHVTKKARASSTAACAGCSTCAWTMAPSTSGSARRTRG